MSKLLEALKVYGKKKEDVVVESRWREQAEDFKLATAFIVEAIFRAKMVVSDAELRSSAFSLRDEISRRLRKEIIEGVFGEFREYHHKLRLSLYKRDWEAAINSLDDLHEKMFEVD